MATLKAMDPNMRQQLAAMLSGDAKAGSIRAQLVHGLLGSSTGDDSGLVGMTPMGAVFDADAANRDMKAGGTGLGKTLSAAAGLIPGEGGLESKAAELLESQGFKKAIDDAGESFFHHPDTGETVYVRPNEWTHHQPNGNDFDTHSGETLQQLHNFMAGPGVSVEESKAASPSVRDQLEAAAKDPAQTSAATATAPKTVEGQTVSNADATKPKPVTVAKVTVAHDADDDHIKALSAGDPKKENFIRQAMQDEGGNDPEDVAITLLDHMAQKNPKAFDELHQSFAKPSGPDPDAVLDHLTHTYSIPEVLAQHYDLDPKTMGAAYDMPNTGKSRPTQ